MKRINLPLTSKDVESLQAGESILLSGVLYTARDAAHKRLCEMLDKGEALPIPRGACIYYAGPCPAAPGEVIGPCGPTTSSRMDSFTPQLIDYGIRAFIGKGSRAPYVLEALREKAVYFAATGGAGMLIASCIRECECLAFAELGAEAIYQLLVEDFPVIVAADSGGTTILR